MRKSPLETTLAVLLVAQLVALAGLYLEPLPERHDRPGQAPAQLFSAP